jgi:hypothetical protein
MTITQKNLHLKRGNNLKIQKVSNSEKIQKVDLNVEKDWKALRQSSKIVQNRTPGTLKFVFSCFLIMIFFIVNPIIFGEVLPAKKHFICWNITFECRKRLQIKNVLSLKKKKWNETLTG